MHCYSLTEKLEAACEVNGEEEAVKTLSTTEQKILRDCKGKRLETGLTKGELMAGTGASEATVRRVTDALVSKGLRKASSASLKAAPERRRHRHAIFTRARLPTLKSSQ